MIDFITSFGLITPIDAPQLRSMLFRTLFPYLKKKGTKSPLKPDEEDIFFSTQICDEKRRNFFFLFFCLVIFLNGFYSLFYQMIWSNEEKGEWGFND